MKPWSVKQFNKEHADDVSKKHQLPAVIVALLEIRGAFSEEEIQDFLFNETKIDDPFQIKDMDKACERILKAVDFGEKICVYGDFDADGVTSTALLYSYLEALGADVCFYIPARDNEGYGMHKDAVKKLHENGVQLIITVDNGISAVEEIAYASSLGIDTVVTDHHMPSQKLPDAVAVVDIHREDCPSRFKNISGVGVAFKLVCALEGDPDTIDMLLDNYSDILCIGTVADMMPLTGENRVFVKRGLKSINNSDRAGIISLCETSGISEQGVDVRSVSFKIVPRINAAGRLGLSDDSVTLLTTEDYDEARSIASKLSYDNSERQRIEKEIISDIDVLVSKNPSLVNDRIIVLDGSDWHQGVIGIVSTRIKDVYNKPCIIITRDGELCRASGRSVEGFDIWEAVSYCSDLLDHYGGHPMAIGLALEEKNIPKFREKINEFARKKGEMPFDSLEIDMEIGPESLDVELAKSIKYLAPFGKGNPSPIFKLSGYTILNIIPLSGNKHIKFIISGGSRRIPVIWLYTEPERNPFKIGDKIDLAVTLDVNEYKNTQSLSIFIKSVKFSGVDYSAYIKSNRLFESFISGETLDREQLLSVIPTKRELKEIYLYLIKVRILKNIGLEYLLYRINPNLTYSKLRVALRTFSELGLIRLRETIRGVSVEARRVNFKVNLGDAPILKKLKEVYRGG